MYGKVLEKLDMNDLLRKLWFQIIIYFTAEIVLIIIVET